MRYIAVLVIAALIGVGLVFQDDIRHYFAPGEVVAEASAPASAPAKPVVAKPATITLKPIGAIRQLNGTAAARGKDGSVRQLALNTPLYEGDLVETATGAFIQAVLEDGEQIFIKPRTQLVIEEYYRDEKGNVSIKRLLRGKLRIISGLIGKANGDIYQLRTHVATIGVRGTEYGVALCSEEVHCEALVGSKQNGLYLSVLEGAIEARSKAGNLLVNAGRSFHQANTTSIPEEIAPTAGVVFDTSEIERLPAPDQPYLDRLRDIREL